MELGEAELIFSRLFDGVPGYGLSHRSRNAMGSTARGFTYGEVLPNSFLQLLTQVTPRPGECFLDLGSGLGKAVVLAALLFEFKQCVGFEILPDLAKTSQHLCSRLVEEVSKAGLDSTRLPPVEVVHGDFLEADFSQADIVFAHASCFEPDLMEAITGKMSNLRTGARVLAVGKPVKTALLMQRLFVPCEMDWGRAFVFIYERR